MPKTPNHAAAPVRNLTKLSTLLRYLARYKVMVAWALIAMVIAAASPLAIFRVLQYVIDQGLVAENAARINFLFGVMMGVIVVMAIATAVRYRFVTLLGERVVADIRKEVHANLIELNPSFFEDNRPGEIASRLTADTTIIETVVGSSASIALRNLMVFIGGTVMLFTISAKLSSFILLSVPAVALVLVVFGRKVRALSRSSQDRLAEVGAMADEAFGAIQVVQGFTQEEQERGRFARVVESTYQAAVSRVRQRAIMTALIIIAFSGGINLVLWQGVRGVLHGSLSPGQLASFVGIAILVAGAVGAIATVYGDILRLSGAAGRLDELVHKKSNLPVPKTPKAVPLGTNGPVEFEGVWFAYPSKKDAPALKDFSLAIPPGKTTALVGPSGAGKSTVFQLALRFFDPQQGRIAIAGVDIAEMDLKALRSLYSIVPQETFIFADSVLQNVRYAKPEAGEDEAWRALKDAQAEDFVRALPEGIHTYLGERGVRLSGGQRQRIAIARAILRNAPILLLDEATSALDSESERLVQKALKTLMAERTTLVIAHRLSTVQGADQIIVLDEGRIVARGDHAALMEKGGLYAKLARLQFQT
jgi:ATP-binding cassette, subfamily B, bacterial